MGIFMYISMYTYICIHRTLRHPLNISMSSIIGNRNTHSSAVHTHDSSIKQRDFNINTPCMLSKHGKQYTVIYVKHDADRIILKPSAKNKKQKSCLPTRLYT